MMSLNSAAMSISAMLSTTIGGVAIDTLGFPGFGISMFILAAIAAITFKQWTHEA
jgi:predicted MFS family arabinose efflux permease